MHEKMNILISGGGTGGHIFPAIAIANALKFRLQEQVNILFVGAKGKMEMEKVPQAGYPIVGLTISGLQRKMDLSNLSFPFKVLDSLWKSRKIIKDFKPHVAVGTGGYASGPLLYAASKKKIPTLILEQNSYPGITNKLLGKRADTICVSYKAMDSYFPKSKIVLTGSPIRREIITMNTDREKASGFFGLNKDLQTLLIIGGSQGAHRVNMAIAGMLDKLLENNIQVLWQTGKFSFEMAVGAVKKSTQGSRVKVVDFITRMDLAYAAADLVISRAGAIAIAEIAVVGKPAIFVPLPSAAEDHQTKNALTLVKGHASLMVKENELEEKLPGLVKGLMKSRQDRLIMVQNLKRFAHREATEKIVDEVLKLIGK